MPAIPIPDLDVPYAAPTVDSDICMLGGGGPTSGTYGSSNAGKAVVSGVPQTRSYPKKGAQTGQRSDMAGRYSG